MKEHIDHMKEHIDHMKEYTDHMKELTPRSTNSRNASWLAVTESIWSASFRNTCRWHSGQWGDILWSLHHISAFLPIKNNMHLIWGQTLVFINVSFVTLSRFNQSATLTLNSWWLVDRLNNPSTLCLSLSFHLFLLILFLNKIMLLAPRQWADNLFQATKRTHKTTTWN